MAEIHRTALQTVARITFTLGAFGCIEDAQDPPEGVDASDGDAGAAQRDGAQAAPDLPFVEVPDGALPDAVLVFPEDAGTEADGDLLADAWVEDAATDDLDDAASDVHESCEELEDDWEAREKCCDEIGWDPQIDPSCTPWGPPVPPAMPEGVR